MTSKWIALLVLTAGFSAHAGTATVFKCAEAARIQTLENRYISPKMITERIHAPDPDLHDELEALPADARFQMEDSKPDLSVLQDVLTEELPRFGIVVSPAKPDPQTKTHKCVCVKLGSAAWRVSGVVGQANQRREIRSLFKSEPCKEMI